MGSALVHTVLGAADALDEPLVALLGHRGYYPRFGFRPAADLGIDAPDPTWGDHFQARALTAHDPSLRGRFAYAPPFDDLSQGSSPPTRGAWPLPPPRGPAHERRRRS